MQKLFYILAMIFIIMFALSACKPANNEGKGQKPTSSDATTTESVDGQKKEASSNTASADSSSTILTTNVPEIGSITATGSYAKSGSSNAATGNESKKPSSSVNTSSATSKNQNSSPADSSDDDKSFIPGYY